MSYGPNLTIVFRSLFSSMSSFSLRSFYFSHISFIVIKIAYFYSSIIGFYYFFGTFSFFSPQNILFSVSIPPRFSIFSLLGELKSYLDALKNLSFELLPIDVMHCGDFLFMWENRSRIGFQLNTTLYFFNCFVSFSYFLKLLISEISDPLGLAMERFDFTDLFLLISFLKLYLKFEIITFYMYFLSSQFHFLSQKIICEILLLLPSKYSQYLPLNEVLRKLFHVLRQLNSHGYRKHTR